MEHFPKGCKDRNDEILKRGTELLAQFLNGNKKLVAEALCNMETSVAVAVVTFMMVNTHSSHQHDIASYLREVA